MAKITGIYIGGPPLDPPDQGVMLKCNRCRKSTYSLEWRKNNGSCPLCQKAYAGPEIEED